ncbi:MAG TPA: helix-turn-helix domain-containing protein [Solirubrobacterales bacterium]|jgi:DNA-binding transcriptional ArsR family regulator|nr:helix-turn-helix domain-containing protein [Solirubrobacterales bacterium]
MATGGGNKATDLFTALGHPLRRRILRKMIAEGGQISPLELANSLDEPLSALSYHVRVLAECKAIKLVRTKQIRGSTQHFYRPAVRAKWARTALKTAEGRQRKKNRPRGEEKG